MQSIDNLFDQLKPLKSQDLDNWHPDKVVDIDIRIDFRGVWHYQGSAITRHRMTKLFSTVLRIEEDHYFLVTPPVKYRISVEDVPFNAVELKQTGSAQQQKLFFRTNMDDVVLVDEAHPVTMELYNDTGDIYPYLMVRKGLKAKIVRSVYYQMAELVEESSLESGANGDGGMGLISAGSFFSLEDVVQR